MAAVASTNVAEAGPILDACEDASCDPCALLGNGAPCDDGNECTSGDTCADGICSAGANVCACQQDKDCAHLNKDLCAGTMFCNTGKPPYTCELNTGDAVLCSDAADTACSKAACDPKTGKCGAEHAPAKTHCDDGDPCTAAECDGAGACAAVDMVCACTQTADCAKLDSGNKCDGTHYCDKSGAEPACAIKKSSVVVCPDNGKACTNLICDPATASCVVALADDAVCDDGDPCTANDKCKGGLCEAGEQTCGCSSTTDCAKEEDGNACNGTLYCQLKTHKCVVNPATVVSCPSSPNPCINNDCQPATGKCAATVVADGTGCDDANPCTGGETCKTGACAGGVNTCKCTKQADCDAQEDGDLCNGTLYCDVPNAKCLINPATVIKCATVNDSACRTNTCLAATGKCALKDHKDGVPCDDENPCTTDETCKTGKCAGGTVKDKCPCHFDADCGKFEDGDLCNGTLFCDKSGAAPVCRHNPATVIHCQTVGDGPCKKTACVAATGKCEATPAVDGVACDDGDICTWADACKSGVCAGAPKPCSDNDPCTTADACKGGSCVGLPLAPSACDDGDPCTTDGCLSKKGCVHANADGAPCDDNNACTGGDTCGFGKCAGKPLPASACDDGNACTAEACEKATGCYSVPENKGKVCNDGDPCTSADTCDLGACKAGIKLPCQCRKTKDCAAAEDGDLCNGTLVCDLAVLPYACTLDTATVVTCKDDGDPCTTALCVKSAGACKTYAEADGKACRKDGDLCTAGKCKAGACAALVKVDCDDGKPCTADFCLSTKGCQHDLGALSGKACDDGDKCTGPGVCKAGVCGGGTAKNCDDKQPCTLDTCDSKSGCKNLGGVLDGKPCDDGDKCTTPDLCAAGKCKPGKDTCTVCKDDGLLWEQTVGTAAKADRWEDVVVTADGRVITVGWTNSKGKGAQDGWVVARDSKGKVLWDKTFGYNWNERFNAAHAHPDGSIAIAGFYSPPGKNEKFWLVRLDKNGHKLADKWQEHRKLREAENPHAIVPVSGGYVMAGLGYASQLSKTASTADTLLMRVKADGTKVWSKTYGVAGAFDIARGMAVDAHEDLLVVGYGGKSKYDCLYYRIAGNGALAWTRRKSAATHLYCTAVTAMPDGGHLIVGNEKNAADTMHRGFAMRIDASGQPTWQRHFTPSPDIRSIAVRALPSALEAGVLVAGSARSAGIGPWGLFVAHLRPSGEGNFGRTWKGAGTGLVMTAAALAADGRIAVAGYAQPNSTDAHVAIRDRWGFGKRADAGKCCTTTYKACDDGESCTANACDAAKGCTTGAADPDGASCDDGDVCTVKQTCASGKCQGGKPNSCDDADPCTVDSCGAGKCSHGPAKDGTACTGGLCKAGKCVPKGPCFGKEGQTCTLSGGCGVGVCLADVCAATPTPGISTVGGDVAHHGARSVNATKDGGVLVSAWTQPLGISRIYRYDKDRVLQWKLTKKTPSMYPWTNICDTFDGGDGKFYALGGGRVSSNGGWQPFIWRIAADGKFEKHTQIKHVKYSGGCSDGVAYGDGSFAYAANGWEGFLCRVQRSGALLQCVKLGTLGHDPFPWRARVLKDGSTVVVGQTTKGSASKEAFFARIASNHTTRLAYRRHDFGGWDDSATDVVETAKGLFAVMTSAKSGQTTRTRLVQLGIDGSKKADTVLSFGPAAVIGYGLAGLADGNLALVGSHMTGKTHHGLIAKLTTAGTPLWWRNAGPKQTDKWSYFWNAHVLDADRVLASGAGVVDGAYRDQEHVQHGFGATVCSKLACNRHTQCPDDGDCRPGICLSKTCTQRQLLSGSRCRDGRACKQGTCTSAGACKHEATLDCDDKQACTKDLCRDHVGCVHLPLADNTACDDGYACTTATTCKAGVCQGGTMKSCGSGQACINGTCRSTSCGGRKGLTWWAKAQEWDGRTQFVSCWAKDAGVTNGHVCNPYKGDTACTTALPVFCFKGVKWGKTESKWWAWKYAEVRATRPVVGCLLASRTIADQLCKSRFGAGWAFYHHHASGVGKANGHGQGYSAIAAKTHGWVGIGDQSAGNCW